MKGFGGMLRVLRLDLSERLFCIGSGCTRSLNIAAHHGLGKATTPGHTGYQSISLGWREASKGEVER